MTQNQTQVPDVQRVPISANYMLALMEAVDKDQTTMAEQQITDADSTQKLGVQLEMNLYNYWMGKLNAIAREMSGAKGDELTRLTYDYQAASSEGQSMESQQDGSVQASQGQTSSDATNLQMKAQMVTGVTSILTMLANLLGQVTA